MTNAARQVPGELGRPSRQMPSQLTAGSNSPGSCFERPDASGVAAESWCFQSLAKAPSEDPMGQSEVAWKWARPEAQDSSCRKVACRSLTAPKCRAQSIRRTP